MSASRTSATTPCSVNMRGGFRRPPCDCVLDVADCDIKLVHSSGVSWKAKSPPAPHHDGRWQGAIPHPLAEEKTREAYRVAGSRHRLEVPPATARANSPASASL